MAKKKLNKLAAWDARMLELMEYCIAQGLAAHQKDFCTRLDIHHSTITHIRAGKQSFQHAVILEAAKLWDISINWIYGLEPEMKRILDHTSGIDMIREGLRMLESEKSETISLKRGGNAGRSKSVTKPSTAKKRAAIDN